MSAYLSACPPARLPARPCLTTYFPACLSACLAACLLGCFLACLPAYLLGCLPPWLPASLPASLPSSLPASLPPFIPASLPSSLPDCQLVLLSREDKLSSTLVCFRPSIQIAVCSSCHAALMSDADAHASFHQCAHNPTRTHSLVYNYCTCPVPKIAAAITARPAPSGAHLAGQDLYMYLRSYLEDHCARKCKVSSMDGYT